MEDFVEVGDKRTYHYDDLYQVEYAELVKEVSKALDEIAIESEENPNLTLGELRKAQEAVKNDDNLSPNEKREQILEIKKVRNDILHSIDIRGLRVALDKELFGEIEERVQEIGKTREIRP